MSDARRRVLERRARFVAAALAGAGIAANACNDRPPMTSPFTLAPIGPVPTVPASEDPSATPPPSASATTTTSAR